MGVMPCNREGCENIMCGRYSSQYGYICDECFMELIALGTWDISDFMAKKRPQIESPNDEWYEEIFRLFE